MKMNIDRLFSDVVGDMGFQQVLYCLLFCLMNSYAAFQMLQYKFVVRDSSDFLCYPMSVLENKSVPAILNKCDYTGSDEDAQSR